MFIFYFIIIIINEFEFDDLKYCVLISVLRFTIKTHFHKLSLISNSCSNDPSHEYWNWMPEK